MHSAVIPRYFIRSFIDDASIDVNEFAGAFRIGTQREDAGEPLAASWIDPVTPEDDDSILTELAGGD